MELGIPDSRVSYLISIGTPIDKYDFSFLQDCRKPILFVHGEEDEFGSAERLRAVVKELEGKAEVQLILVPGAGHFFEGHLDELKQAITSWIVSKLNKA